MMMTALERAILRDPIRRGECMAMRAASEDPLMTADELAEVSIPNKEVELVRGRLVVRDPAGTDHGRIQANLHFLLMGHVRSARLGRVFGQDTGFQIAANPDTVRGPDLAFVSAERAGVVPTRGFAAVVPDLAAEIVSYNDRPGEIFAKVGDYLETGARLVWVIDPFRRLAHVYRADGSQTTIGPEDHLDGEVVVPGFRCRLADVLDE